ncbi:MAG: metal ABC transporter solute-binding protein, Zn/Mn family [Bacilli bacterium]
MKKWLILLLLLGTVFFIGCDNDDEDVDIYTTIYPVEFLVKEIVKDRLTVKSVYPRGKDVHDYESNPKDLIKMSQSKLIFYIGLGLEIFIERAKDSTLEDVPIVALSHNILVVLLNSTDLVEMTHGDVTEENVFYDPHIWLDPNKMIIMTDTVLNNILERFVLTQDDIDFFTNNANTLKTELALIDTEFVAALNNPEIANKTIMVDHDAYVYWTIRYGIDRIKLRNDNESSDVVPQEIEQKIALAEQLGIKHIVVSKNELESSIVDQYLSELGLPSSAKVSLHHLGTITSDEEEMGLNYFSIMRENIHMVEAILPKQ